MVPQPHETQVKEALEIVFNDTLYTPQPELEYFMSGVDIAEFNRYRTHVNAVVIGLGTDETDPGNLLVKQLLPAETYKDAKQGGEAIFLTRDTYAKNQLLLILCARDVDHLKHELNKHSDWLKQQYDDLFAIRQGKYLFHKSRQSDLEEELLGKYGWSILVPWGYLVLKEAPEDNFFWMGREQPFRWLSVNWTDGLVDVDQSGATEMAQAYADSLYGNVRFTDFKLKVQTVDFKNWTAWKITGLWEEVVEAQGGPFIHYIFYDGVTDRTYQINVLIYFPGSEKIILMRQLDLIAHSFFVDQVE